MNCPFESRLSAYHDNELSPADRVVVDSHLERCADCRVALASIREVSGLFAASAAQPLSQIARHRLHRRVDREVESGLVRLSWAMSAVAAAILVVGSVWLKSVEPMSPPVQNGTGVLVIDASSPAEQYYLADATVRSSEEW
jgi:anti-sigma factor RsiW